MPSDNGVGPPPHPQPPLPHHTTHPHPHHSPATHTHTTPPTHPGTPHTPHAHPHAEGHHMEEVALDLQGNYAVQSLLDACHKLRNVAHMMVQQVGEWVGGWARGSMQGQQCRGGVILESRVQQGGVRSTRHCLCRRQGSAEPPCGTCGMMLSQLQPPSNTPARLWSLLPTWGSHTRATTRMSPTPPGARQTLHPAAGPP